MNTGLRWGSNPISPFRGAHYQNATLPILAEVSVFCTAQVLFGGDPYEHILFITLRRHDPLKSPTNCKRPSDADTPIRFFIGVPIVVLVPRDSPILWFPLGTGLDLHHATILYALPGELLPLPCEATTATYGCVPILSGAGTRLRSGVSTLARLNSTIEPCPLRDR